MNSAPDVATRDLRRESLFDRTCRKGFMGVRVLFLAALDGVRGRDQRGRDRTVHEGRCGYDVS
jgi:hypothetical protein